jgi:integrase
MAASKKAGIEPLSPHALRKAAGQWLIDLGMPLELVSRVLGHADTRITETVYARVSPGARKRADPVKIAGHPQISSPNENRSS